MTRMTYNWIMRRKLVPRENTNGGVSNFTGRIKGMHVFIGNFTYIVDFMILEDISSIIDPRLSQVVLGRPFVEMFNMTHDPPEGVVSKYHSAEKKCQSPSGFGPIPKEECHVVERKAQVKKKIALVFLTKEAQAVTSRNDRLAILRCPQIDQTATIEAQMIEEMIG
ncbi:hypothetical protein Tco_1121029 [Tanacetum coccineum]|uniref:MAK10-like protein n=1 Tax=Tanacetum coccineum TaxID=301880 RepID=A0ABQ5IWJ2_9ASTR